MKCPINVLEIAEILNGIYKSVVEIVKVNNDKLKIIFGKRKEANNFIQCSTLRSSYHVYAPSHLTEIDGVVYDQFISPAEIKRNGFGVYKDDSMPAVPVLDACLLLKRTTEDRQNEISQPVRITFATIHLPDYLQVRNVLLPLRFYYHKPMLCTHCKQYGHTARYCFNKIRCLKCGKNHSEETCSLKINTCFRCNLEHALLEDCIALQEKHKEFQLKQKHTRKFKYSSSKNCESQVLNQETNSSHEKNHPEESRFSRTPAIDEGKIEIPVFTSSKPSEGIKRTTTVHRGTLKKKTKQKIPSTIQSMFSITLLVKAINESFVTDPKTKTIITAMTPFIIHVWKELLIKYPPLAYLASAI